MSRESLLSLIQHGGPVLIVLAVLSIVSIAVIVVKIVQLAPVLGGAATRKAALARWAADDKAGAEAAMRAGRAPADRVVARAMGLMRDGLSGPMLDAELARRGNEEVTSMSRMIRFLELVAMVSPLLGLLGTVLGMIQSFQDLETAQGAANAAVLAGGIWEALMTTAAGLVVAIPAAIGAAMLNARIELATQAIESAVGDLQLVEHTRPARPDPSTPLRSQAA
jgi:biopolymer transport protein ExbB